MRNSKRYIHRKVEDKNIQYLEYTLETFRKRYIADNTLIHNLRIEIRNIKQKNRKSYVKLKKKLNKKIAELQNEK